MREVRAIEQRLANSSQWAKPAIASNLSFMPPTSVSLNCILGEFLHLTF